MAKLIVMMLAMVLLASVFQDCFVSAVAAEKENLSDENDRIQHEAPYKKDVTGNYGRLTPNQPLAKKDPLGVCTSGVMTGDNGIMTDGYDPTYPLNIDCSRKIQAPTGEIVRVIFADFCTEEYFDYVYLYDGPDSSAQEIAHLSGCPPFTSPYGSGSSASVQDIFISTQTTMTVRFVSDYSNTASGFILSYRFQEVTEGCPGATATAADYGTYTDSGGLTQPYLPNLNCNFQISGLQTDSRLTATFLWFCTQSPNDHLDLYDASTQLATYSGFCNPPPPASVATTTTNTLSTTFVSDGTENLDGWVMEWTAERAICGTDTTFTYNRGLLYDGTTNYYAEGLSSTTGGCAKVLQAPDASHVVLVTFLQFCTEASHDVLTFRDGATASSPIIAALSGSCTQVPNPVHSTGQSLLVQFDTDSNGITSTGFSLTWSFKAACTETRKGGCGSTCNCNTAIKCNSAAALCVWVNSHCARLLDACP